MINQYSNKHNKLKKSHLAGGRPVGYQLVVPFLRMPGVTITEAADLVATTSDAVAALNATADVNGFYCGSCY